MLSVTSEEEFMTLLALRVSTLPSNTQRPKTSDSASTTNNKTPTPLIRRRSVSSMKGLLPLTLSASCSSSWSNLPTEDGEMQNKVDQYFPEFLAQDLEASMSVFMARNMTAGTPATSSLSFEDRMKARFAPSYNRIAATSPYHAASVRVQSLGAIEERSSMVSFLDQPGTKTDDAVSDELDLDSLTGTESSCDMVPPSFRFRKQSVVTAATSLASGSWRLSQTSPLPPDGPDGCSWIDNDSEGEEQDDSCDHSAAPLSPQPPTPSESGMGQRPSFDNIDKPELWTSKPRLHKKSHSVSGASPRRHASTVSMRDSWKTQPILPTIRQEGHESKYNYLSPLIIPPKNNLLAPPPPRSRHSRIRQTTSTTDLPKADSKSMIPAVEPLPINEEFIETDDDDSLFGVQRPSVPRNNSVYIRPSPPPSPLPSVQAWLNGSVQPYVATNQNDDLTKIVPLPPDVIETLRISTSCFPETMLLTSSLTVETIRSYSKKVRQPSMDSTRAPSPDSSSPKNRKSLWRKVVPYKRNSSAYSQKSAASQRGREDTLEPSRPSSVESVKSWMPLKNVFGCCSDYICDALYAHIVAYNYVSALAARLPPPPKTARPRGHTSSETQSEDIPKKAAALLGLGASSDHTIADANRFAKRLSTPLGSLARESMVTSHSTTSVSQDNAVRSIQIGLLRCICRLTSTARLMSESGTAEERMVEMDEDDTDMLFIRSLCEIVRMTEESS